jgi:hypothetical protein
MSEPGGQFGPGEPDFPARYVLTRGSGRQLGLRDSTTPAFQHGGEYLATTSAGSERAAADGSSPEVRFVAAEPAANDCGDRRRAAQAKAPPSTRASAQLRVSEGVEAPPSAPKRQCSDGPLPCRSAQGGSGEGGARHPSERAQLRVSEGAEAATLAWAAPGPIGPGAIQARATVPGTGSIPPT